MQKSIQLAFIFGSNIQFSEDINISLCIPYRIIIFLSLIIQWPTYDINMTFETRDPERNQMALRRVVATSIQ